MATTYAAYYNIATSSRRTSSDSTSSNNSKTQKIMNFLAPRMPLHEPLTPTKAGRKDRAIEVEQQQPIPIYDSVLRRPLFQKAKKGNEMTIAERRSSSAHGKPSFSSSVDRVYKQHLPGAGYFGMDEK